MENLLDTSKLLFQIPTEGISNRSNTWVYDDQNCPTKTSKAQGDVLSLLFKYIEDGKDDIAQLENSAHVSYLLRGLERLPPGYVGLDASQPWLCFWILQALAMLGYLPAPSRIRNSAIGTIVKFQNPTGGFGGGPGQVSHLAPTYAAIHALAILGGESAYNVIHRESLYKWFLSLKQDDGSFRMSHGGEIDIRASYCVLASAALLDLLTPELTQGMGDFIARCQGFDGGLGCYPGVESHGGYTYCGMAGLAILGETSKVNLPLVRHWASHRQMLFEGGFQGRTNKLVDGCYSFWVGALFPIIAPSPTTDIYDRAALQKYILNACQVMPSGGLRDKPGMSADYYHTCYVLSGLSISHHTYSWDNEKIKEAQAEGRPGLGGYYWSATPHPRNSHHLIPTHPLFNIPMDRVQEIYRFFYKLPQETSDQAV